MSVITDIADMVVVSLNSRSFARPFTAERLYQPTFELAEMDTLHVSVVPKSMTVEPATRLDVFCDCTIDIGVQQRVDPQDQTTLDALVGLAEAIGDHLRTTRLEGVTDCLWMVTRHEPLLSVEHLDQFRQFTSVITVTYRVKRR
ncbi:MAG TPA: hypothetical protein PLL20_01160 [Phycisphaerae bacterium]|nr:hypothetical protein [Phycisphaerae bacterium]